MTNKSLYIIIAILAVFLITMTAFILTGKNSNNNSTAYTASSTTTTSTISQGLPSRGAPPTQETSNAGAKDSLGNYFTPSATEGPYYPYTTKFSDIDNDLTIVGDNQKRANGNVVEINGQLLGKDGQALSGYTIELWHADTNGIYNHPNDSKLSQRDQYFQNYGEATTDSKGKFTFKTILAGIYEGRMRHMHYQVKLDGVKILTSQFLIDGDGLTQSDNIYTSMGAARDTMLFKSEYRTNADESTTIIFNPIVRVQK